MWRSWRSLSVLWMYERTDRMPGSLDCFNIEGFLGSIRCTPSAAISVMTGLRYSSCSSSPICLLVVDGHQGSLWCVHGESTKLQMLCLDMTSYTFLHIVGFHVHHKANNNFFHFIDSSRRIMLMTFDLFLVYSLFSFGVKSLASKSCWWGQQQILMCHLLSKSGYVLALLSTILSDFHLKNL